MAKTNLVSIKDKYGDFDFNFLVESTEDDTKIDLFKAAIADYYETSGVKVDYILRSNVGHVYPNAELGNYRWGKILPVIPKEVFARHGIIPIGEKGSESYKNAVEKSDSTIIINVDGFKTPVPPPQAHLILEQIKGWKPQAQENKDFLSKDNELNR